MKHTEQWTLYDSIVQSYRSNFIASQSLMLAVGALFINENILLVLFVAFIAMFQMWYIWFRIIRVRTIIADFHKFNALYDFSNIINAHGALEIETKEPLTEYIYIKDRKIRKQANKNLSLCVEKPELKHNFRLTRIKLDIILPTTFSLIWIAIVIYCINKI